MYSYILKTSIFIHFCTDPCVTTQAWTPGTTLTCPNECLNKGPSFTGNIADPINNNQYVACWNGVTVGCIICPSGLLFNEAWNACLFKGMHKTMP